MTTRWLVLEERGGGSIGGGGGGCGGREKGGIKHAEYVINSVMNNRDHAGIVFELFGLSLSVCAALLCCS